MMHGTNRPPFYGPIGFTKIEDVSNHDFKARGCTGCQPGSCAQSCSSCAPSCGRSGVDRPFGLLEDSMEIMLDLPCPPSVNRLRKIDPVGIKLRKKFYKEADLHLMAARTRSRDPLPVRKIKGPFEISILLNGKMTRIDADNAIKVTLDYLVSREFVTDDSPKYLRRLVVEWSSPATGCRVVIRSLHTPDIVVR